jgi:hypothetical protein
VEVVPAKSCAANWWASSPAVPDVLNPLGESKTEKNQSSIFPDEPVENVELSKVAKVLPGRNPPLPIL